MGHSVHDPATKERPAWNAGCNLGAKHPSYGFRLIDSSGIPVERRDVWGLGHVSRRRTWLTSPIV